MQRYEYDVVHINTAHESLIDRLDEAGREGWRVIHCLRGTERWNLEFILERPVPAST